MVHAACVSHHIAARVGTMAILALTLCVSVALVATRAILLVVATEAILLVVCGGHPGHVGPEHDTRGAVGHARNSGCTGQGRAGHLLAGHLPSSAGGHPQQPPGGGGHPGQPARPASQSAAAWSPGSGSKHIDVSFWGFILYCLICCLTFCLTFICQTKCQTTYRADVYDILSDIYWSDKMSDNISRRGV